MSNWILRARMLYLYPSVEYSTWVLDKCRRVRLTYLMLTREIATTSWLGWNAQERGDWFQRSNPIIDKTQCIWTTKDCTQVGSLPASSTLIKSIIIVEAVLRINKELSQCWLWNPEARRGEVKVEFQALGPLFEIIESFLELPNRMGLVGSIMLWFWVIKTSSYILLWGYAFWCSFVWGPSLLESQVEQDSNGWLFSYRSEYIMIINTTFFQIPFGYHSSFMSNKRPIRISLKLEHVFASKDAYEEEVKLKTRFVVAVRLSIHSSLPLTR